MPYPNTTTLQLQVPDRAAVPSNDYAGEVGLDQALSSSLVLVDEAVARHTGSCVTTFMPTTGSVLDLIGGTDMGSGIMGVEYNRGCDRVILEVIGLAHASGSNPAGKAEVDIEVQQGVVQPANFSSIFTNVAFKLAHSGSHGLGPSRASTFVSGSNMVWRAGSCLRAVIDATSGLGAGLSAMRGLTVQVFWKPSGSLG